MPEQWVAGRAEFERAQPGAGPMRSGDRTLSELSAGECFYALGGGDSGDRVTDRSCCMNQVESSSERVSLATITGASTARAFCAQDAIDSHPASDDGKVQSEPESDP